MSPRNMIRIAVVCVIATAAGLPVAGHYRAKGKVRDYRHALARQGEKMTVAALTPAVNKAAVSAGLALMAAADKFGTLTNLPSALKVLAPGKAMITCQQEPLPSYESTNVWPPLARLLDQGREEMTVLRSLSSGPAPTLNLDYSLGAQLPLPHVVAMRTVGQLLSAAALLDLHDGRLPNALENLQALCALASGSEEPLLYSELARVRLNEVAARTTWEALQCRGWRDEQLQTLQHAWESMEWLKQADPALAMERIQRESGCQQARQSYPLGCPVCSSTGLTELVELGHRLTKEPLEGSKNLLERYPGYWAWTWWQSYDDELAGIKISQAAIEAVRSLREEKVFGPALKGLDAQVASIRREHPRTITSMGAAFLDPSYDARRLLNDVQAAETRRSLCVAAIALERWRIRQGAYPAALASLVPEFIAAIPRDVVDGAPLRYRLNPDGSFLLYSVGENGSDEGGDPAGQPPVILSTWLKWWLGHDAVWPVPAGQAEVLAHHEQVLARYEQARAQAADKARAEPINSAALEAFRKRYGLR